MKVELRFDEERNAQLADAIKHSAPFGTLEGDDLLMIAGLASRRAYHEGAAGNVLSAAAQVQLVKDLSEAVWKCAILADQSKLGTYNRTWK